MAQKLTKYDSGSENAFPPEADGEFGTVSTQKICEWRDKLNARFGIGQGKLKIISEPTAES